MFNDFGGLGIVERADMGKKKAAARPKAKQEIILVYKSDVQSASEFKTWLEGLADHVGAPVTVTIDMALKAFAAQQKYKPMPKRLVR